MIGCLCHIPPYLNYMTPYLNQHWFEGADGAARVGECAICKHFKDRMQNDRHRVSPPYDTLSGVCIMSHTHTLYHESDTQIDCQKK